MTERPLRSALQATDSRPPSPLSPKAHGPRLARLHVFHVEHVLVELSRALIRRAPERVHTETHAILAKYAAKNLTSITPLTTHPTPTGPASRLSDATRRDAPA